MPIYCQFLSAIGLCYGRFRGSVSLDDIADAHARHARGADGRPGLALLIDLREVERVDLDMAAMRTLIGLVAQHRPGADGEILIVLLAGSDATYGHARQFQTLASLQGGLRVLLERAEAGALRALGRPETDLARLLSDPPGRRDG